MCCAGQTICMHTGCVDKYILCLHKNMSVHWAYNNCINVVYMLKERQTNVKPIDGRIVYHVRDLSSQFLLNPLTAGAAYIRVFIYDKFQV